ncbi:hypothetical protein [Micromonospora sp. DT31]|uniref:hypothetical protein n=1 Tax=Micromonospora sp. DT31 TaxID=3393434 RepID=UPI003CF400C3
MGVPAGGRAEPPGRGDRTPGAGARGGPPSPTGTRSTGPTAALDEPLLRLVDEPRQLAPQLADALWIRVVDVPAALAARRYATDVDVVIDVTDDPSGHPQERAGWVVRPARGGTVGA